MVEPLQDLESFDDVFDREYAAAGDEGRARIDALARHYERGAQVTARRLELGWTQQELATEAGIDQADLSRIERGQGNPTERTWARIAEALEMRWVSALVPR